MNFKVTVASKNEKDDKTYKFPEGKVKIGRLKDNDIVLDFPAVSGYHGKFRLDGGDQPQAFVTDFGSLNGISIDGQKIKPNQEVPVDFEKPVGLCIFCLTVTPETSVPEKDKDIPEEEFSQQDATMPLSGILSRLRYRKTEDKLDDDQESEEGGKQGKPSQEDKPAEAREEESAPKKDTEEKTSGKAEEKAGKAEGEDQEKARRQEETGKDSEADKQSGKTEDGRSEETPAGKPPKEAVAAKETAVTLKAGETLEDLDFFAEEIFSVSGVVLSRGKPVEGVTVSGGDLGEVKTDDKGVFAFDEVVEGSDYRIVFAKTGFEFDPGQLEGKAEEDVSATISATRLVELNGRVLHKGKPLAEVEVDGGPLGKVKTEADGYFNFPAAAEGTEYEFSFGKPEFRFDPEKVGGKAGDGQPIASTATKLVTVKGRVVHKGKPLEGVEIDAGPLGKTTTDADGVYVFKDVPEDTEFTIKARKPKYHLQPNQR